jgi:hypothetical protein
MPTKDCAAAVAGAEHCGGVTSAAAVFCAVQERERLVHGCWQLVRTLDFGGGDRLMGQS